MRITMICDPMPVPGRLNEDACYFAGDGEHLTLLVIDGAGQRAPTTQLTPLTRRYGEGSTAARYAAQLTRQTVAAHPELAPKEQLLAANDALRRELEGVYGALTAEAMLKAEPHLTFLEEDPRLIRLALPICVATLAQVDLAAHRLNFAHAGDTAMFLFGRDGGVSQVTDYQIAQHHEAGALAVAKMVQEDLEVDDFAAAVADPRVREAVRTNGLYHNFVNPQGQPDPEFGIGAIDGLPALEAFVQYDELSLDGIAGVLLCSDGAIWPAPLDEDEEEETARFVGMRERIEKGGLRSYLAELRAIEKADATRALYPRFKVHDDATAIYLEL